MDFLKDHFYTILIVLFFIFLISIFAHYDFLDMSLQISEYQKILNHEFGCDFNSYNEYVLYKIERGY